MIPHSALFNKPKDRSFAPNPAEAPTEDYHELVDRLEKEGEWEVQRVPPSLARFSTSTTR